MVSRFFMVMVSPPPLLFPFGQTGESPVWHGIDILRGRPREPLLLGADVPHRLTVQVGVPPNGDLPRLLVGPQCDEVSRPRHPTSVGCRGVVGYVGARLRRAPDVRGHVDNLAGGGHVGADTQSPSLDTGAGQTFDRGGDSFDQSNRNRHNASLHDVSYHSSPPALPVPTPRHVEAAAVRGMGRSATPPRNTYPRCDGRFGQNSWSACVARRK